MLSVILVCPAIHCHALKPILSMVLINHSTILCFLSLGLRWEVNIQELGKPHTVATEVNVHQTLAVQMRFAFMLCMMLQFNVSC